MRKPFLWKARKAWYVKSPGGKTNVRLSEDEAEAYEVWREMVQAENHDGTRALVAAVCESFLEWAEPHVKPTTYANYAHFLAKFSQEHGYERVGKLRPKHVTAWLAKHPEWGTSGQRAAITAIKRAINWALQEGHIERNPLAGVRRPQAVRRDVLIADADHARMMQLDDGGKQRRRRGAFRQILIAMRHSGARPGSIASVRIEDVSADVDRWVLKEHKTRLKTGKPLVVYLSPCLQALTRILMSGRTSGTLFRDSRGKPWTKNGIVLRMRRLREALDLPAGSVAYAYRHTYTTTALLNGTDIATVAELLGHTDVAMIVRHYGHLTQAREHLKQAAAGAVVRKPR